MMWVILQPRIVDTINRGVILQKFRYRHRGRVLSLHPQLQGLLRATTEVSDMLEMPPEI